MKLGNSADLEEKTIQASKDSDEAIYLTESRYGEPKEIFKRIADMMASDHQIAPASVIDVGCATGEFLHYLSSRLPECKLTGYDLSALMIEKARTALPNSEFEVGSVVNKKFFEHRRFETATCIGVLCFLDEAADFMNNILSCVQEGGMVYIASEFNDDPVDVVMRYRRGGLSNPDGWMAGWNVFSVQTIEDLLRSYSGELNWTWTPFNMPFKLEKRDDPMRAWTIKTESNPIQMINGACQILNWKILQIKLNKVP